VGVAQVGSYIESTDIRALCSGCLPSCSRFWLGYCPKVIGSGRGEQYRLATRDTINSGAMLLSAVLLAGRTPLLKVADRMDALNFEATSGV
jgi:hypothetical protein